METSEELVNVNWAGFHADRDKHIKYSLPITTLLPLFKHNANSPAVIRHCLTVVQAAVQKLNPG